MLTQKDTGRTAYMVDNVAHYACGDCVPNWTWWIAMVKAARLPDLGRGA